MARRSPALLSALLVALAASCLLSLLAPRAFVAAPGAQSPRRLARAAVPTSKPLPKESAPAAERDEVSPFAMPKPDMAFMNANSRVGQTYDQDKRGNMWQVEIEARPRDIDEPFNGVQLFGVLVLAAFGGITFFAVWTGNDPRFGGVIGDGALTYGD